MHRKPLAPLFFLLLSVSSLYADEQVATEEYTHIMSENESRNEARKTCFLEAKRKILKRVADGFDYAEFNGEDAFERKTIEACLPVLLKIETVAENWSLLDKKIAVTISVKTAFDNDYLIKRIRFVKNDKELQQKIQKNQARQKALEEEYIALQKQLEASDKQAVIPLRKKRQAISSEIDRVEEVKYLIAFKTKLVSEKIDTGMTVDEVVSIAGQPRSTATCEKPDFLNYGNIWIRISDGIVADKIPVEKWSGPCYRYSTADSLNHFVRKEGDAEKADETEEQKYAIHLKTGQTILTSAYYTADDIIYYKKYGGIIGIGEDKIKEIKEVE